MVLGKELVNGTKYLTMAELEAGLDTIRKALKNEGVLELIVRRPQTESCSAFPKCHGILKFELLTSQFLSGI
jgi:hypothetical protein